MGQICNSVNRVYVHEDSYDKFLKIFLNEVKGYEITNGLEHPDADLGPMVNETGIEKTKRHIRDALDKGAKVEYGGEEPEGDQYKNGHFFTPTAPTSVNHEMLVMTKETFGPVVPIMKVNSRKKLWNTRITLFTDLSPTCLPKITTKDWTLQKN